MRPPSSRARGARLLALAAAFGVLGACTAAPTVPIPPPSVESLSLPDAEGLVTVRGTARPDVFVACINRDTRVGVIVASDAAGAYTLRIPAATGQTLVLFQLTDDGSGAPVERIVGRTLADGGT